jgi:hypothetical protein
VLGSVKEGGGGLGKDESNSRNTKGNRSTRRFLSKRPIEWVRVTEWEEMMAKMVDGVVDWPSQR